MIVRIAGRGCVTPLGCNPAEVWASIRRGAGVDPIAMVNPETGRKYIGALVPAELTAHLSRETRLRRSSAISLLAAAAGQAAMKDSGLSLTPEVTSRLALVFAVSSGGVQYTRRFYEQVVKQGANAASPMLFPETVYNAPASHLAALLGVDGATYTLVGDGTVGLQALGFGAQLLALGEADHVLVVAAEELDWILLEAHRDWRLTTDGRNSGALLAEGAGAVLLARDRGEFAIRIEDGETFANRSEAASAMDAVLCNVLGEGAIDFVVGGGNETWVDETIEAALRRRDPALCARIISPKRQIGEAVGASALLQVVLAAEGLVAEGTTRALVAALGWNQQAAAAIIERGA